jgi:hypothetical protein
VKTLIAFFMITMGAAGFVGGQRMQIAEDKVVVANYLASDVATTWVEDCATGAFIYFHKGSGAVEVIDTTQAPANTLDRIKALPKDRRYKLILSCLPESTTPTGPPAMLTFRWR